jgi:hypothetical protein
MPPQRRIIIVETSADRSEMQKRSCHYANAFLEKLKAHFVFGMAEQRVSF